jgi:death-on-curing family protein
MRSSDWRTPEFVAEIEYLTAEDVLATADQFFRDLGYAQPILRGNGYTLLESAVHRAENVAHYGGADLVEQAAALCNGIALNHPFLDGNKRTAFAACVTFLRINGHPFKTKESHDLLAEQIIDMHEQTNRFEADAKLAAWLRSRLLAEGCLNDPECPPR